MVYFNIKTSDGVETIDELDRSKFKLAKDYSKELKVMCVSYRELGTPFYLSTRSTKEWRDSR